MPNWLPGVVIALVASGAGWLLVGSQRSKVRVETAAIIDKRWKDISDATDLQNEKLTVKVASLEKQVCDLEERLARKTASDAKQARLVIALRVGIGRLIAQLAAAGLPPCWDGTVEEEE